MTPFDDDRSDMDLLGGTPPLSDSDIEALLAGRALPGFDDVHSTVRMLRTAAPPPAPAPTGALLAVMEAGFDPLPLTAPDAAALASWRRWGARLAVATAAIVATTLGAAAANALPAPVQNAVASAVGALTPLDLPRREAERAVVEQEPEVDGGSSTRTGSAPGSEAPPAGVRMADDDLPPEDLVPRTPGQVGQPAPAQPSPAQPSPAQPSSAQPSSAQPSSGPPTAGVPAPTARDERDEPDTDVRDERDSGQPDTDEPDADEPDQTDRLDLDEPDIDEPDADEPDADEPDADEPDTDEPDTDERDTLVGVDEAAQNDD